VALAASAVLVAALTACAPTPAADPGRSGSAPSASVDASTGAVDSPSPTPSASVETVAKLPTDCRAILSPAVLAQLKGVPLNDKAFGKTGVQADGSLVCVWGDPAADTTNLATTISRVSRGKALDAMNALLDQKYTCYTPSDGTRCEKTWQDAKYPVVDGRTVFWRAGVLIDTRYSNLAPSGYTDSIIAHVYG